MGIILKKSDRLVFLFLNVLFWDKLAICFGTAFCHCFCSLRNIKNKFDKECLTFSPGCFLVPRIFSENILEVFSTVIVLETSLLSVRFQKSVVPCSLTFPSHPGSSIQLSREKDQYILKCRLGIILKNMIDWYFFFKCTILGQNSLFVLVLFFVTAFVLQET